MSENKDPINPRGPDRRSGDRRQKYTDPADLPFPDRRSGLDRRQMDRRIATPDEESELLKRIGDEKEKDAS